MRRASRARPNLLTSDEAVKLLKCLREAHLDEGALYQLTDYHWLLLYEALGLFCDHHNDSGRKAPPIGPYRIGRLDAGGMFDPYFWDLDFVIPEIKELTPTQRESIQVSEETWGVVQGLKPHPEELRLGPWERPGPHVPRGQPKGKRLVRYPPSGLPEWYTEAEEYRNLRVLSGNDREAFDRLVMRAALRPELRQPLVVLQQPLNGMARQLEGGMRQVYDLRMRMTGQTGVSDYDLGFTNFLYTFETSTVARQTSPPGGTLHRSAHR